MTVQPMAKELWRSRLEIPCYTIGQAARLTHVSSATIRDWHKLSNRKPVLGSRQLGAALSYFQLIELAVVAAARHAGVSLRAIRNTREYCARSLKLSFPFAHLRFQTDGRELIVDQAQLDGEKSRDHLVEASNLGQMAWKEIMGRLVEFDYDHADFVTRWFVDGRKSPIVIDPRIAFGAPSIGGIPTSLLNLRVQSGESPDYVAEDFDLDIEGVLSAIDFEMRASTLH